MHVSRLKTHHVYDETIAQRVQESVDECVASPAPPTLTPPSTLARQTARVCAARVAVAAVAAVAAKPLRFGSVVLIATLVQKLARAYSARYTEP